MTDEDWSSTTTVLAQRVWRGLRGHLTPATFGSAVTAIAIAVWYVSAAKHDISNAQRDIHQLHDTVGDLQRQSELLQDIKTQLAVMSGKVDSIADEVDRQREWRDRIEGIAESPPHARRRK